MTQEAAETKPAATKATAKKTPRPKALTLQQKFIKLREAIPAIVKAKHSEGVEYKFAKISDVYRLLTPAMNEHGVNFDIVAETATRHTPEGDPLYYHYYTMNERGVQRTVWVYEEDLTIRWTNADNPEDILEVTLHAIGTNDGGPDKAKGSALTYCLKYYLFEKFGIDQGEDDPDMKNLTGAAQAQQAQPQAQNQGTTPQNSPAGRNTQQTGKPASNGQTGAQKPLTDAQLSRMYRKGEDVGYTQQQIDDRIRQKYGQQDPHLLTRAQYDEICNSLDAATTREAVQMATHSRQTPGTASCRSRTAWTTSSRLIDRRTTAGQTGEHTETSRKATVKGGAHSGMDPSPPTT